MKSSSIKSKRHSMATISQEPQPILPARNPHHEKSNSFMKPWDTEDEPQIYSTYKLSQYNHETKGSYLHRNRSELPPVISKSPQTQSAVHLGSLNKSPTRMSITKEKEPIASKTKRVKKVNTEVFSIIEYQKTYEDREMNPEQSVYDYWKNSEKMSTTQKPKFFLKTENGQVKIMGNPSGLQSRKSPENQMISSVKIPNIEEMNTDTTETPRKKLFVMTKKSSPRIDPLHPMLGLESENISLDISPLQASPMRKKIGPASRQSRRKSSDSSGRFTAQAEVNFQPYEARKNSNPKKDSSKRRTPSRPATKINLLDTAKNENGRAIILPNLVNSQTVESDHEHEGKKRNNVTLENTSFIVKANENNNNTIDNGDKMFREEEITEGTLGDILIRTEGPEVRKLKTKHIGSEKIVRTKNNLEVEQEIFESRNRLVPHPKGNNFAYMYRRAQKKRKAFEKEETKKMILRHHPTSEDQIKPLLEPPSPKKFMSQYERLVKLKAKFEEGNHVELPGKVRIVNKGTGRGHGGDAPLLRNIKKQIDMLSKEEGSTMMIGNRMKIKTNEQMFGMSGSRSKERFSFKDIVTTANNLAGRKLTPLFSLVSHTFDQS